MPQGAEKRVKEQQGEGMREREGGRVGGGLRPWWRRECYRGTHTVRAALRGAAALSFNRSTAAVVRSWSRDKGTAFSSTSPAQAFKVAALVNA